MSLSEIANDMREFRCAHCEGKVRIPKDTPATTGPCPHCGAMITSPEPEVPKPAILDTIPLPPPLEPAPAPPPALEDKSPSPAQTNPEPQNTAAQNTPDDKTPMTEPTPRNKRRREKSGLIPAMMMLLVLILGAGAAVLYMANEMGRNIPPPSIQQDTGAATIADADYLRRGWQKEAFPILRKFLAATSQKEKLPFILNKDTLVSEVAGFYENGAIDDTDTPADGFSSYELSMDDRKRGIFLMTYEQLPWLHPGDFFRPLAAAEVQAGIVDAGLLQRTLTRTDNDSMTPLCVYAFFKRGPEGLKLDWEIFAQTKYRTFLDFVSLPEVGRIGVFRAFIVEDNPDERHPATDTRTYRIFDIANRKDSARINVKADSEIGHALSVINWRDTKDSRPTTRTVTLELKWTGEPTAPELEISRFICWEFFGLGGEKSNTPASQKKSN